MRKCCAQLTPLFKSIMFSNSATMNENEGGKAYPTNTSLFIPISLSRKLYGASAQNRSKIEVTP